MLHVTKKPSLQGFFWIVNFTENKMDMVNHPSHYTQGKIECIDALEAATANLKGLDAVCTANAIKYLWRWQEKDGVRDLRKAIWYINKMLESRDE